MRQAQFDIYLPIDSIEKAKSNSNVENYIVRGYASSNDRDYQGEKIDQSGMDISYLMSDGYIDIEHDKSDICGVPTENTHMDEHGLYLEAVLFGDNPGVQRMLSLQRNFDKSGIKRNIGFSIEGTVLERDSLDESIVRQVQCTGVALTTHPANKYARVDSWDTLVKSMNADTLEDVEKAWCAGSGVSPKTQQGGAALRTESLSSDIISLASRLNQLKKMGVEANGIVAQLADELDKHPDNGAKELFLQVFSGVSHKDAVKILNGISIDTQDFANKLSAQDND